MDMYVFGAIIRSRERAREARSEHNALPVLAHAAANGSKRFRVLVTESRPNDAGYGEACAAQRIAIGAHWCFATDMIWHADWKR
jgi:hypothetical protein